jgi:hypothetical protein
MVKRIPIQTDFYSGRSKPSEPIKPLDSQPEAKESRLSGRGFNDVPLGSWLRGNGEQYPCFDHSARRLKAGK